VTVEVHSARHTRGIDAVPLDAIWPSPLNPRKHFRDEDLAELAESIRQDGLLEPLVVRRRPGDPEAYELIAGERRLRACRLAGLEAVPVRLLSNVDDATALRLALVENLQRVDLDPIEEAEGYAALNRVCGLKQAEIAAAVKRQQPFVAKRMALLDLPEDVRERIRAGEISVSHGVALARFRDFPKIASWYADEAAKGRYSSKALESGLPHYWELEREGLVTTLNAGGFDTTICREACPFKAFQKASSEYGAPICLKPDHAAELQRAHDDAQREALQRQLETARAHGGTLPSMSDLKFGTYEQLDRKPNGCDAMCPCLGLAIGYGGKPIQICTDPKRYRKLEAADRKLQQQETRKALNARIAAIQAAMDRLETVGERELALIGSQVVGRFLADTNRLALRHAGDLLKPKDLGGWDGGARTKLAALAPMDLVRFLVEAVLIDELHRSIQYGQGLKGPSVDWYLGDQAPAAPAAAAAIENVQEDAAAERLAGAICGGATTAYGKPLCPDCDVFIGEGPEDCERCEVVRQGEQFCRVCVCTETYGCDPGCYWIEDELCSVCAINVAYEQEQAPAAVAHA
jgi:ParB family chromosome partitioning protein